MIERVGYIILCRWPEKIGKTLFVKWAKGHYNFFNYRPVDYKIAIIDSCIHSEYRTVCWEYQGRYVFLRKGVKAVYLSEDEIMIKDIIE